MSDTFASPLILTELARRSYFNPRRELSIRDETLIKLLATDPVRRLPGSTKRHTGFLASYENDEGTFRMMGIAIPIEEDVDPSTLEFPVVENWYVNIIQSGGMPLDGFGPAPPPVVTSGCLCNDDHVVATGFNDMTGTARKVVCEHNDLTQVQQFTNRAAVVCCEFVPTADNRLIGGFTVSDAAGNQLHRDRFDTSLDIPDWTDGDGCSRKEF